MNYFSFRYTLDETEVEHKLNFFNRVQTQFLDILRPAYFTIGYEELDKFGEPTAPHIHIAFTTSEALGTVRTRFKRDCEAKGEERSGNALYSLKNLTKDISDLMLFFRYPLKQNGRQFDNLMLSIPYEGFNIAEQRNLAYDQWCRNIEYHKKAREKTESKASTYDLMVEELDKVEFHRIDDVMTKIVEYYAQKKLSMNIGTMSGYALTYGHSKKLISTEIIVAKMLKHANL